MKRRALPVLSLLLFALAACGEHPRRESRVGDSPAIEDDLDADESASISPYITGGLGDQGHPSVGVLGSGTARCSATLIGTRTVLTAGHCIKSASVWFSVGGSTYTSAKVTRHPGYSGGNHNDLAVVVLQQPVAGVAPSPINTTPPQVGQQIILVGYGKTGETSGGFGSKRVGYNVISAVGPTTFKFLGQSNVCNGDSGGPTFIQTGTEERVAGVHSTKSGFCGSGGTDMRVDPYLQWITSVAAGDVTLPGQGGSGGSTPTPPATPPPPPPSGSCHNGSVFDWSYCSTSCPCAAGEGDCDSDAECQAGLVCQRNVGAKYGVSSGIDVCEQPASGGSGCHSGAKFGWSYCSTSCPCAAGEGDCDSDAECQSGLVCRHNVGAQYGVSSALDVCEQPTGQQPAPPPPPGSGSTAKEGESCAALSCAAGLACVTVFTAGYTKVVGQYCMEQCQSLGSDPACDGGEVCTLSKTAGKVCFNSHNPQQGYTSPGGQSQPSPSPAPSPPGGSGACGFNTMEAEVFKLLNAERAQHGAAALQCDPQAVKVARAHSQDMCTRHYFSHYTPEGDSPWDRLKAGGVSFSAAGENIAWGQTSAQQVHTSWMNSSGHRKNMLNGTWVRTGIGYVQCTGKPYWTEVFMR